MTDAVGIWLAEQTDPQRSQLQRLHALIKDTAPDLIAEIKWSRPCYSGRGMVCYLQSNKSHVTLGFARGTGLPDPNGLLQGTGKDMRHVKLSPRAAFDQSPLAALIRAAWALDRQAP